MKAALVQAIQTVQEAVPPPVKAAMDVTAVLGWISALTGALTGIAGFIAACASCAWAVIRLYETRTCRRWLRMRRMKKRREGRQ